MTASALIDRAGRLWSAAAQIEAASSMYLVPALHLLPAAWVGPAADYLEEQLVATRNRLAEVAGQMRRQAVLLRAEAAHLSCDPAGSLAAVVGVA